MEQSRRWILAGLLATALLCAAGALLGYRLTVNRLAEAGDTALALASDRLQGRLDRYRALPFVVARHPVMTDALRAPLDARQGAIDAANALLVDLAARTGALDIYLMNEQGMTIAASNHALPHSFIGLNFGWRPYFIDALAQGAGAYHALGTMSGQRGFYFSAPLADGVGVVVVKIDVDALERGWALDTETVFFTDASGVVFVANRPGMVLRKLDSSPALADRRQYTGADLSPLGRELRALPGSDVRIWHPAETSDLPGPAVWRTGPVEGLDMMAHVLVDVAPARAQAAVFGALGAALGALAMLIAAVTAQRRAALDQRLALEAQANARLEGQVAARTAELEALNATLRQEVSDRTAAEAQLRTVQDALVQAGKLKALGEMSAGISHELNQPLTAIQSLGDNARTLLSRGRQAEAEDTLARIGQLAGRMGRIIRNLRAFARKEGEPLSNIDPAEVVHDALQLVEARVAAARAEVRFDPGPAPMQVRGGRVRLQQVVVNLICNALDAMEGQADPRRITIRLVRKGDTVALSVADTGPGLATPEQVFDPFYTTKPVGQGLGLGLSISYGIVQSFGGQITGTDAPGGGALFTVVLPCAPHPADPPQPDLEPA